MDKVSVWKPSEHDLPHSELDEIGKNISNFNGNYAKRNFSNKFNMEPRTSSLKKLNNLENTLIEHMGKRRSHNINNLNQFIYNTRKRTSTYKIVNDNNILYDNNKLHNTDLNKHNIFNQNNGGINDISDMDTTTSSTSYTDSTPISAGNTVDNFNNTKVVSTNIVGTGNTTGKSSNKTSNVSTSNVGNVGAENKNKSESDSKSMTKAEFQRRMAVLTSWYNKLPIIISRKDNSIQIPKRVTVLPKEKNPILIESEYGLDVRFNLTILIDILTCPLCKGLFHNAQTIRDCMHTFCKSCLILSTFENGLVCPTCFSPILSSITEGVEPDTNIQTIVDKLFPHFAQNEQKLIDEMKERKKNYKISLQDNKISDTVDTKIPDLIDNKISEDNKITQQDNKIIVQDNKIPDVLDTKIVDTVDDKKLCEVTETTIGQHKEIVVQGSKTTNEKDKEIAVQVNKPTVELDSKSIDQDNKDVHQQDSKDVFVQHSKTTIEQDKEIVVQDSKTTIGQHKEIIEQHSKTTIEQEKNFSNIDNKISEDNKGVEQDIKIDNNNARLISSDQNKKRSNKTPLIRIEEEKKTEAREVITEEPKEEIMYRKTKISDPTETFLRELNKCKDLTRFFESVSCLALVHVSDNQMNGPFNDITQQMGYLGDRLRLNMSGRYPRKYICVPKRIRVIDIVRYLANELLLGPKYNVVFMLKNLVLQKTYTIEFIFQTFKIDASKCVVFRYEIVQHENSS
ncbi:RING finger protein 5 [Theileria parva strain Muguga]|uniref:RING-type domain-containing protein n=1 Tax=Theileria parva TaxID=5875 RepID=Q4MZG7_THEPA|nr:RING finger protein 5 [Theileria parva strain Muguga]EAN31297.1 RING finger protein 5 [Theileria parva strain Muguga]|eukprot:XP_763580.1 hypothetical protein [Theileria parva strain Muguga]